MAERITPPDDRRWLAEGPARSRRRRWLARVLIALVITAAIVVGVLSWLWPIPQPTFVPVWITRLPDGRTHIPWTEQDRSAFVEGHWLGTGDTPALNPGRDHIRVRLRSLKTVRPETPIVVYLSGPACSGVDGGVSLLPADAIADHPRNRLPLRDVLDALRDSPSRHQLLVLDLSWNSIDTEQGRTCDDVPAGILRDLAAVPDVRRLVLCSCSPGEIAHSSADLGRSVFGHYLEEGLRGFADGWPAGERDRRVSVRELAAFVRARAERWSQANRGTPQSPILIGFGDDFPIKAVALPMTPRALPEPDPYPDWLAVAWQRREQWLADGRATTAPRAFRGLERSLLDAEHEWHAGQPAAEIQSRLQTELARGDAAAATFAPPQYPIPTLALVRKSADSELREQLRRAILQAEARPRAAAEKAPIPAPLPPELEPFRTKPHPATAAAAFDILGEEVKTPMRRVQLLQQLLSAQQPTPQFAETLLLQRLSELATLTGEARWPSEAVGELVETTRVVEDAASGPGLFAWLEEPLTETDRLRHEAESFLFAPGFVAPESAAERAHGARDAARDLQRHALALRLAMATSDEALTVLGGVLPRLDDLPESEAAALAAAESTRQLADALIVPATPPTSAELEVLSRDLESKRNTARRDLDEFLRPLRPEALAVLRRKAETGDASPALLAQMTGILDLPLLPSAERSALRDVTGAIAKRFNDDTIALDRLDTTPGPVAPQADPEPTPSPQNISKSALARARKSLALLQLGGVPEATTAPLASSVKELDSAIHDGRELESRLLRLNRELRQVWQEQVPTLTPDWRLTMVLGPNTPPWTGAPERDPVIAQRRDAAQRLWAWQAARFAYEAGDPTDPTTPGVGVAFAASAARSFRLAAGAAPAVPQIRLTIPQRPPALTPASPVAMVSQAFRAEGIRSDKPIVVRFFSPNPAWLVAPEAATVMTGPDGAGLIPMRLEAGAGRPDATTYRGMLIEASSGGRSYHERLPVDLDALMNRIELLVSIGKEGSTTPLGTIGLRPINATQSVHLFLRNPTTGPRTVILRLSGVGRETAKLVLAPKKLEPVVFLPSSMPAPVAPPPPSGAPAATGPELQELREPLAIELLNGDTRDVLQTATLRVDVADPARYVDVEEVLFTPANGGSPNRLSARLSASGKLSEPPCLVDMVLPAERNEGLGIRDGKLSGVLPTDNKSLNLYVENLGLPPGADRRGIVTFTVDGSDRAFTYGGTFAHRGLPVRLTPLLEPAVRLRAAAFARGDKPLPVRAEVDNAPDGSRLELRLGQSRDGGFAVDSLQLLNSARQRLVAFAVNPADSALLFRASLMDWETTFPIDQVVGQRELEARLLDRTGALIARASQIVTFDINLPDGVRILDPPAKARRDQPLQLKATAGPSVSGFKEVVFFFGKPVNQALPPDAKTFPAEAADDKGVIWKGALDVGERKGRTEASVKFTNRAGLSQFDTTVVELLDPADFLKAPPGSIEGHVLEGTIGQTGLKVYLYDAKGAPLKEAATKDDGSFKFEGLPPGKYTVYSVKTATNRSATKAVEVEAGKPTKVEMVLFL